MIPASDNRSTERSRVKSQIPTHGPEETRLQQQARQLRETMARIEDLAQHLMDRTVTWLKCRIKGCAIDMTAEILIDDRFWYTTAE